MRNGTTFWSSGPCLKDASVVKKLRDGGAMIIGMTNMHEIGIGVTGNNPNRYTQRPCYTPVPGLIPGHSILNKNSVEYVVCYDNKISLFITLLSRLHGTPRNPYNVNYYTGGSSSGSAAAVASGIY
jgi:Asp-tRNA(Asn)/Glu-tRNA(Gln) amidotransferase A subunit family amidase